MAPTVIPAFCPSCGAIFRSRLLSISENVKHLTLINNHESCPFCGNIANLAEGVFDITNEIISIISAPEKTKQMLKDLNIIVKKAYKEKTDTETVIGEIEKVDESLGQLLRQTISDKRSLFRTILLIIIFAINSCNTNLNVSFDVNKAIDQIMNKAPSSIIIYEGDCSSE